MASRSEPLLGSPRVQLKYIVEADRAKWEPSRARWNLLDTTFVHPDDAATVYQDPELTVSRRSWEDDLW